VILPTHATFGRRKSVLVVEDHDDLRHLFRDWLKAAGFGVRDTADGLTALRMIEAKAPDVVVLDIHLLTLDGASVRQEMAAHAETSDIPIIVVTGAVVDVEKLNATRVLRKPVDSQALLAAVRSVTESIVADPLPRSAGGLRRVVSLEHASDSLDAEACMATRKAAKREPINTGRDKRYIRRDNHG
jgi:DNA-binding response OmpR family regulator